jgi:adenylate kinase family enzyme
MKRLKEFHDKTEPVLDYYATKGKVANINADQHMAIVTNEMLKALEE